MSDFTLLERGPDGWEVLGRRDVHLHVTEPNFIFEKLLPTFNMKPHSLLDPQFLIDFKRARPHADCIDRAASWSINGQPAPLEPAVMLGILGCQTPLDRLRITQLFNQRCGIDICRRVQGLYDNGHVVLPKSASYTLDLELLPGQPKRIHAAADMSVFEYNEQGHTGASVSCVSVEATYDLSDGRVCYSVSTT